MSRTPFLPASLLAALLTALLLCCPGCARREAKSAKAEEAERWRASLTDSVSRLHREIETDEASLARLRDEIASMLADFDHVSNPREVNGYLILKQRRAAYPLTSTGLAARITDDEEFELVAALRGGVFTRIAVSAGGRSAESADVPHDQALNHRHAGLNTVAFQGPAADSVASLLASCEGARLTFLDGERAASSWDVPAGTLAMVAATWRLAAARKEVRRLEAELPMLNAKIAALRRMQDAPAGGRDDSATRSGAAE